MSAEDHLIPFPDTITNDDLEGRLRALPLGSSIPGFTFAGLHAGVKRDPKRRDFGLISAVPQTKLAGVYTTNQIVAAPVTLSRAHLQSNPEVAAVLVNSGNANACTGEQGWTDAVTLAHTLAASLSSTERPLTPEQIQIGSTGVIGAPLPIDRLLSSIPKLVADLAEDGLPRFAESIMTTDNRPKVRTVSLNLSGVEGAGDTQEVHIGGCAKGAGMIHPNMATMLGYVCTNAPVRADDLQPLWERVCDLGFNAISIDGDTSTNDTALCLASGSSSNPLTGEALCLFERALIVVSRALALDILRDGEGVEHVAHLTVSGARHRDDARQIAETIALSPLVKTAMNGRDPNWGRIIAAVGRSGIDIDPEKLSLSIGEADIYKEGRWQGVDAEQVAHQAMCGYEYPIHVHLGIGDELFTLYTTDLSSQYVRINADYRS